MANLLDQASIVLTPTAYDDGKVLCAKPSDPPYGDFDFSRNSAATRVNAQGLVENVQILSNNLVQNGDFSEEGAEEVSNGSFSQEGSEEIINGDFATDSDWTKGTGWSIGENKAICIGNSGHTSLTQSNSFLLGKTYKVTFDIVVDSGNFTIQLLGSGSDSGDIISSTQVGYTEYISPTSNRTVFAIRSNDGSGIGSITNISVKEVAQDWTLGTGWSIGEDKAVFIGSSSGEYLVQNNVYTLNSIIKLTFDVLDYVSGSVRIIGGGTVWASGSVSSNGTHTFYINTSGAVNNNIYVQAISGNFNGSITNISVKEVLQNWGNPVYSGDNSASLSIDNNALKIEKNANLDWRSSFVSQTPITYVSGKTYKITYSLKDGTTSGADVYVRTNFDRSANTVNVKALTNDWVEYTDYYVADTSADDISFGVLAWQNTGSGQYYFIDNVSIIEITDDTNLPRINYEGFSYQDALGSELITNGNDTSNIVGLADNQNITIQTSFLTIGKTYKIDFEIYDYVEGSIFLLRPNDLGVGSAVSANGNYTYTVVADASTSLIFRTDGLSTTLKLRGISVKEYLGQEVVPDSGCGSWLFEPQSTNLITYSSDYTQWGTIGSPTITSNFGISPDGTQNSTRLQFSTNDRIFINVSASGDITFSVYLKGVGQVRLRDNDGSNTKDITLTSEWIRYEFTFNDTITNIQLQQAIGTSDFEIWGAQVEALSYPTSLIPTEGSSVTRNQDVCNNGGSLASINSTEGVLYAEIAALANSVVIQRLSLSDGTNSNRIYLQNSTTNNQIFVSVVSGGVSSVNVSTTSYDITQFNKIAIKFKANDFALWINGIKVATDTNAVMPIGLNELAYDDGNGGLKYFGKTKALAVWKEALSDEELTELTTI